MMGIWKFTKNMRGQNHHKNKHHLLHNHLDYMQPRSMTACVRTLSEGINPIISISSVSAPMRYNHWPELVYPRTNGGGSKQSILATQSKITKYIHQTNYPEHVVSGAVVPGCTCPAINNSPLCPAMCPMYVCGQNE